MHQLTLSYYLNLALLNSFPLFTSKIKYFALSILLYAATLSATEPLAVQLASLYHENVTVESYLVSEKFDGVRAIWREGELRTRNGRLIHAPKWFTSALPDHWLDGELWSKRQDFAFINAVVRKKTPLDVEWRQIKYMVFDAPDYKHSFLHRAEFYTRLLKKLDVDHIQPIEQWQLETNDELSMLLQRLTKQGAEGLILHKKAAHFQAGRSNNLLKLKPYMADEAEVIGHIPGKGKYKQQLGALLVSWQLDNGNRIKFKIGSGFSDAQRKSPPAIGDIITFKYHGLTKNKIPRFASFLTIKTIKEKATKAKASDFTN